MAPSWFRFYSEVLHDPKILRLTDKEFRCWTQMLCVASENNGLIKIEDLAIHLRMPAARAIAIMEALIVKGLIDSVPDAYGVVTPHNWKGRQYDHTERSESGSRGNHVRWHVRVAKPDPDCPYCIAERLANPIAKRVANRRDTDQIRSDTDQIRSESEATTQKITGVKHVTEQDIEKLQLQFPGANVKGCWERAQDWLRAEGKRKKDEVAFLRNWIREDQSRERQRLQATRNHAGRGQRAAAADPDIAGWERYQANED